MKKIVSLSLCLLLAGLGTACGNSNDKEANNNAAANNTAQVENNKNNNANAKDSEADKSDAVSMSEWDGEWNDMGAYLDDPALDEGYKIAAEKDGKTPEEVKSALKERRKSEFAGMVVEGDKVTFLDGFKDKDGKEIASAEYKFTKSYEAQHGNSTLEWDAFEATDANAKYPVLLMMPVHGEEAMTHFHMRYGDDVDKLLAMDDWFPTFVKPSTTTQQLIDEITE